MRRPLCERGQASVEFVGTSPMLVLALLVTACQSAPSRTAMSPEDARKRRSQDRAWAVGTGIAAGTSAVVAIGGLALLASAGGLAFEM